MSKKLNFYANTALILLPMLTYPFIFFIYFNSKFDKLKYFKV